MVRCDGLPQLKLRVTAGVRLLCPSPLWSLTYTRANRQNVFSSEFMKRFPQNSEKERELVWDQVMFDSFADYVDKLKLNEAIKGPSGPVQLGVSSKFDNSDIELTWAGITRRNNEDCLLIRFQAFMNRFDVTSSDVTVDGRSDYWGDMWVLVRTPSSLRHSALARGRICKNPASGSYRPALSLATRQ